MRRNIQPLIVIAVCTAMLLQVFVPAGTALALTGGPTQPEFTTFQPVGTSGMVDPVTGEFRYSIPAVSIPGPNGSGYSLGLSYHSGMSPEEDASWVGFGWTLNAGAVTRAKRGFPDDYAGDSVRYWNRTRPNWTVTAGLALGAEGYSVSGSSTTKFRYNSYKGFSVAAGLSADVYGIAQLGVNLEPDGLSFSYGINPAAAMSELGLDFRKEADESFLATASRDAFHAGINTLASRATLYGQYTTSNDTRATNFPAFDGWTVLANLRVFHGEFPCVDLGTFYGLDGSFSMQTPKDGGLSTRAAYGYMYSARAGAADMMDYYVENDAPYAGRDRFLSPALSNADYFTVSGEGIGGGFRLYNKKPGQFHPNETHSMMRIVNGGYEPHVGTEDWGALGWFGAGRQTLDIGAWNDANTAFAFAGDGDGDEPYFFRMNNDRGGAVSFAADDDAVTASIATDVDIWGFEGHRPQIDPMRLGVLNGGMRSGRSTYVAYTTVDEMMKSPTSGAYVFPNYQAYGMPSYSGLTDDGPVRKRVAEFALTTQNGLRYTYDVPVYARKEKNLQYGLRQLSGGFDRVGDIAYAHVTAPNAPVVVGEERDAPYASVYLLGSITTPDYVDRTMDGPSTDDYGGYTQFTYMKTAGSNVAYGTMNYDPSQAPPGNGSYVSRPRGAGRVVRQPEAWASPTTADASGWYRWRVPYAGLRIERNELADPDDDMGSVAMGEREIQYLATIETKTHVAVFVTNSGIYTHGHMFRGSGEHRMDGYEASHFEYDVAGHTTNDRTHTASGPDSNQLRRLERIELWSKDASGNLKELVQTTHFEYDYSLCPGLPNSSYDGQNPRVGKLTLRRVYSEFNGVRNAAISPYVFGYEYRSVDAHSYDALPGDVFAKYEARLREVDGMDASSQNPAYADHMIDRWGNYQADGANRWQAMIPWVDQTPSAQFDPAAWHLKWIRLPSGGEIQVRYEQNDYGYVQNHPAMAMAPLCAADISNQRYYLDLTEILGPNPSPATVAALADAARKLYVDGGEKAYLKFLTSLDGSPASISEVDAGTVKHVTGYAKIVEVGVTPANDPVCPGTIFVRCFSSGDPSALTSPMQVAANYVQTQRNGIVGRPGLQRNDDADAAVRDLMGHSNDQLFDPAHFAGTNPNVVNGTIIDPAHSYVRLPLGTNDSVVVAKKGGGVRVKRVLTFDPGLQDRAGHLYGTEYLYQTPEGFTSGVATNEPEVGREESALVRLLDKRTDQSWLQRLIAGKDKDQFEGPIGASLLPGPAVTYSRVVEKSIHDGITNSGFTIREYCTTREYPSQCIYGPSDVTDKTATPLDPNTDFLTIPTPFFSYNKANIWVTQGYRFVLNDMNGQVRSVATYGGDFEDRATWVESSSLRNEYFTPGEHVAMLYDYTTTPTYRLEDPGREMEVTMEGRSIEDVTVNGSMRFAAGVAICVPAPMPFAAFSGTVSYSASNLRRHVACKVVRYPAIVRSTTARKDGIASVVENVGFDPLTGQPIVTRTVDGFHGLALQYANGSNTVPAGTHDRSYRTFGYPAALEYRAMGQKAGNERADIATVPGRVVIDKRFENGKHYLSFRFPGVGAVCTANDLLTAGDLVNVYIAPPGGGYDGAASLGVYYVASISGNRVILQPHSEMSPTNAGQGVSVRIIRSGRTNQLDEPRGGIQIYAPD